MANETDLLPVIVGYRTAVLPDLGIQLELQVALTPQDFQNRKFHAYKLAMHRDLANDLGRHLKATVDLQRRGPGFLE
jgi:hypothetical protein